MVLPQQSLPLKYRPHIFDDVIGQETISRFLSQLIKRGQVGKNIILSGVHGSGKTTNSRIYARALNCLAPTSSGNPCNECRNCSQFFENKYTDFLEVDGASRGRKAEIEELVAIAKQPPLYGKFRVINIDECQGLGRAAWDTLLKLTEEPPPHLVFIFTTTELNKVREAIRSRCQCLPVNLLDSKTSLEYIRRISDIEKFIYEPGALEIISFISMGHPRDLIKNLEQVSYIGDITVENVKDVFNIGYIRNLVLFFSKFFSFEDCESALEITKRWNDIPNNILNHLKEFLLFIFYNEVLRLQVEVNPIFNLIPKQDVQQIFLKFQIYTKSIGLTDEQAFQSLLEIFNGFSANSKVSLEVFLINTHNFIFHQNLNRDNFGKSVVQISTKKSSIKKTKVKGRQFVSQHAESEGFKDIGIVDSGLLGEITFISETEGVHEIELLGFPKSKSKEPTIKKLYPHNLPGEGFALLSKAGVKFIESS